MKTAQLCEYTENRRVVHSERVDSMVCGHLSLKKERLLNRSFLRPKRSSKRLAEEKNHHRNSLEKRRPKESHFPL